MTLRVILQIVPMGDETNIREIGRLDIFNKGEADSNPAYHKYGVIDLSPKQQGLYDLPITHRREHGAWQLVQTVLSAFDIKGP